MPMRETRTLRGTILALLAAAAFVPLHADTYQFIISEVIAKPLFRTPDGASGLAC